MGIYRKQTPRVSLDDEEEGRPPVARYVDEFGITRASATRVVPTATAAAAGPEKTRDDIAQQSNDYWRDRNPTPASAPRSASPPAGQKPDLEKQSIDFWKNRSQPQRKQK